MLCWYLLKMDYTNIEIKNVINDLCLCQFISHNIIPLASQEMTIEPESALIYLCHT